MVSKRMCIYGCRYVVHKFADMDVGANVYACMCEFTESLKFKAKIRIWTERDREKKKTPQKKIKKQKNKNQKNQTNKKTKKQKKTKTKKEFLVFLTSGKQGGPYKYTLPFQKSQKSISQTLPHPARSRAGSRIAAFAAPPRWWRHCPRSGSCPWRPDPGA